MYGALYIYVWPQSSKWYVTRDPTVETTITNDIYYKWLDINAFAWTQRNIATYKNVTNFLRNLSCTMYVLCFNQTLICAQINHQPDATIFQFIILTFIYSSTCFGRLPAHHQELNDCGSSLWFYLRIVVIVVLCSWSARPRTQHDCHHDTKVKPEAATAVIELLMMGG